MRRLIRTGQFSPGLLVVSLLLLGLLFAGLVVAGRTGVGRPGGGAPATAAPATGETPLPPALPEPAVQSEGFGLRLVGLREPEFPDWAPDGRSALIRTVSQLYRLRLVDDDGVGAGDATPDLQPVPDGLTFARRIGWTGPETALLLLGGERTTLGELLLATGEWRPLASRTGRPQVCQNGADWLWVDVTAVREGGGGYREIGTLYRTPAPNPPAGAGAEPLGGQRLLEQAALLGRLADGSCLVDGMDGRLLLLRPGAEPDVLSSDFSLPTVIGDGTSIIWREQAGNCPMCIEIGPGVPFRRLVWWRPDHAPLIAELEHPQVIDVLPAPDGKRLVVGHRESDGSAGAIGMLGPDGFRPDALPLPTQPVVPAGWLGHTLLLQRAAERWNHESPVLRADDGAQAGEHVGSGTDGGLLLVMTGQVYYLTPDGKSCSVPNPGPLRQRPPGGYGIGYQPQAPYLALRDGADLLLLRCETAAAPF